MCLGTGAGAGDCSILHPLRPTGLSGFRWDTAALHGPDAPHGDGTARSLHGPDVPRGDGTARSLLGPDQ